MSTKWGGRRLGAGRKKGEPNKASAQTRIEAKDFFGQLLDDEMEAKFWRYFITGYVVEQLADGTERVIPIPLNQVAWSAFKRAVEYKRGMPVETVPAEDKHVPLALGMDFETTQDPSRVC